MKNGLKKIKICFILSITNQIQPYLNELSTKFPDWYQENQNKADYFLIAYAKVKNLVLVTQEDINRDGSEKNYKIYTVCYFLGARCIPPDNTQIFCLDENNYDFECICFNELVKRERLYDTNL